MAGPKRIEGERDSKLHGEKTEVREIEAETESFLHPIVPSLPSSGSSHFQGSENPGLKSFLSLGEGHPPRVSSVEAPQAPHQEAPTIDFNAIAREDHRALLEPVLTDADFLKASLDAIYPEVASHGVKRISPSLLGEKAKAVFEVRVEFEDAPPRRLLLIASNHDALGNFYRELSQFPENLTHRFGSEIQVGDKHLFSLNFYSGVPLSRLSDALESLVGVPGHPFNQILHRNLSKVPEKILVESLDTLRAAGVLEEADYRAILGARLTEDSAALAHWEKELWNLLYDLDKGAIAAYFNFYQKTHYQQSDPRRENIIFRIEDGQWNFKVIDYESLTRDLSAKRVVMDFDIFESRISPGLVTQSVRPWVWSFTPDKSGFFETIFLTWEDGGWEFLQQAQQELAAPPGPSSPSEQKALQSLIDFLNSIND